MNLARGQPLFCGPDADASDADASDADASDSDASDADAHDMEQLEPITDADLLPSAYSAPAPAAAYPDSDSDAQPPPDDLDPRLDQRDAAHVAALRRVYLTGFSFLSAAPCAFAGQHTVC